MVDHIVDASVLRGRVEIRTGVGRRRRWSDEAKARIVAASFAPGAVVSEVARRHEISPQHLFAWRKAARAGLLTLPSDATLQFVPVVAEAPDRYGHEEGWWAKHQIDPMPIAQRLWSMTREGSA
jgi:transposase